MSSKALRARMAHEIIDFEARRDKEGRLVVYNLPANDGGGRYEVAGINEKYDKEAVDQLVELLHASRYAEAEVFAAEYIAGNTDSAQKLTTIPSVEFYLRDCVFNRGATGCVKILQLALGVNVDGKFGDSTVDAMRRAEGNPQKLLTDLRNARERYERDYVGYRANFWNGLVNRWNNSLRIAKTFPDKDPDAVTVPVPKPVDAGTAPKAAVAVGVMGYLIIAFQFVADHPFIIVAGAAVLIGVSAFVLRSRR